MRLKQDSYMVESLTAESHVDATKLEKQATPVFMSEDRIKYQTFPFDFSS